MTRKEIHEYALATRKKLEDMWFDAEFHSKRAKLRAKCEGLCYGDRAERYALESWINSEAYTND